MIGHGVASYGAADRYLGLLAATLGDHTHAIEHFEQALALNREMGATTWLAHTLYAYGRTLRMRGGSDDAQRASALLSEAATLAERIGCRAAGPGAGAGSSDRAGADPPPTISRGGKSRSWRLVAAGRSNREIGKELYISGHTVANHVRNILPRPAPPTGPRPPRTRFAMRYSAGATPGRIALCPCTSSSGRSRSSWT